MMKRQTNATGAAATATRQDVTAKSEISPELVREVADRVYAMLRRDLQIERERHRWFAGRGQTTESEDR